MVSRIEFRPCLSLLPRLFKLPHNLLPIRGPPTYYFLRRDFIPVGDRVLLHPSMRRSPAAGKRLSARIGGCAISSFLPLPTATHSSCLPCSRLARVSRHFSQPAQPLLRAAGTCDRLCVTATSLFFVCPTHRTADGRPPDGFSRELFVQVLCLELGSSLREGSTHDMITELRTLAISSRCLRLPVAVTV